MIGRIFMTVPVLLLSLLPSLLLSAQTASDPNDQRLARIEASVSRAELIFKGSVVSVGPPPPFEGGGFAAIQKVSYLVEELLLGDLPVGEPVIIELFVVRGSRTAESGKNELSKQFFAKNSVHLVIAKSAHGVWESVDEDYGTLAATPENELLVRTMMDKPESSL
jgi:hypothetical protein